MGIVARSGFALGLLAAGFACGPEPAPSQPPEAALGPELAPELAPEPFEWRRSYVADTEAGLFAIVDPGTPLRTAPSQGAPNWVYDGFRAKLVKVVARGEDFVEIQLDWERREQAQHCERGRFDLGLHVFVREGALATVTTTSASIELAEGVGVNVAPGVRVLRSRGDELTFDAGIDVKVPAKLAEAVVGKLYVPARADSVPTPEGQAIEGWLSYAGHELAVSPWRLQIYAKDEADAHHMLIGLPCLQVSGQHRAAPLSGGVGGAGCGGSPGGYWIVEPGAELRWAADKREAGRTYGEYRFRGKTRKQGRWRCFIPTLGGCALDPTLELCVDEAAIVEADDPLDELIREQLERSPDPPPKYPRTPAKARPLDPRGR